MGGVVKSIFGGGAPKVKVDRTAQIEAERQRDRSRQEAAAAGQRQSALEEEERKRKKNVKSGGRESTILAGESSGGLLGQ